MMNRSRYNALFNISKKKNKYNFDNQTYSIKNKLLIFSTILIAMTFVSPKPNGTYEINMGIIKGDLNSPELLFVFLGIVVLYHLLWFIFHIRKLIVNRYPEINRLFMQELANNHAKFAFKEIVKLSKEKFQSVPNFEYKQQINSLKKKSTARIPKHALSQFPNLTKRILEDTTFKTYDFHDSIQIDYEYRPNKEDYVFFKIHKDLCWIIRIEEMFVSILPITYGIISLFLVTYHILCKL